MEGSLLSFLPPPPLLSFSLICALRKKRGRKVKAGLRLDPLRPSKLSGWP